MASISSGTFTIAEPGVYTSFEMPPRYEYSSIPMSVERMHELRDFREREPETIVEYMEMERRRERMLQEQDVVDRIMEQYTHFIRHYGTRPNALFINREDHYKLMQTTGYYSYNEGITTFRGLKIVPTIAEETYVGLIPEH